MHVAAYNTVGGTKWFHDDGQRKESPRERRRLPMDFASLQSSWMSNVMIPNDWVIPSRERTLLLMRLNMGAYPFCTEKLQHGHGCSFPQDTMTKLFENGQSLYGPNVTTMEQEQAAAQNVELQNWNLLIHNNNFTYTKRSIPQDMAKFDIGVSAMEWNIGNTTILTFRGTFSQGDYANIEHWMIDYLLEKSTDRMKQAWVQDAGLEWTPELQERLENHDDVLDKVEIRAVQHYKERRFPQDLEDAIAQNATLQASLDGGGLTLQDARDTGYWKLTKHIVDQVFARTTAENRTLILTGHSQGGTRAQLASMYLQQAYGIQVPTVSFAATGAACVARLLFDTSGNLLQYVNPFIPHDQMVEYAHPLDPWGNAMLGQDTGGQVCYVGIVDDESDGGDPALEYCSKIYGWPGPALVANEHSPTPNLELKHNFQRCRYFTHDSKAMFLALSSALNSDGTTDGGCVAVEPIPENDPYSICPTGELSLQEEEEVFGLIAILVIALVLLPLCICYWCWRRRRKQIMGYSLGIDENDAIAIPDNDEDPEYSDEEPDSIIELPTIT
jgi:cbb3-type cytochrome oxidase subunit 3